MINWTVEVKRQLLWAHQLSHVNVTRYQKVYLKFHFQNAMDPSQWTTVCSFGQEVMATEHVVEKHVYTGKYDERRMMWWAEER